MKKTLLVSLILLSGILLTACGKKSDEQVVENNQPVEVVEVNDCEKAVQKYLDGADKKGSGEEVKAGDNIVVDYIGRLEDGTVFDTSIQSIAEACGKYATGRNYTEGLSFEVGAGQMIKGFDEGVLGMKLGQTKTVQFGPKDGYGEYDKESLITVPVTQFGDISQLNEGDTVDLGLGMPAKILKITDKEITFDFNHELAGKDLIFDITVKDIYKSESKNESKNESSDMEIQIEPINNAG